MGVAGFMNYALIIIIIIIIIYFCVSLSLIKIILTFFRCSLYIYFEIFSSMNEF
jgi:hypothetical protein